jgi:hypothetical protein
LPVQPSRRPWKPPVPLPVKDGCCKPSQSAAVGLQPEPPLAMTLATTEWQKTADEQAANFPGLRALRSGRPYRTHLQSGRDKTNELSDRPKCALVLSDTNRRTPRARIHTRGAESGLGGRRNGFGGEEAGRTNGHERAHPCARRFPMGRERGERQDRAAAAPARGNPRDQDTTPGGGCWWWQPSVAVHPPTSHLPDAVPIAH